MALGLSSDADFDLELARLSGKRVSSPPSPSPSPQVVDIEKPGRKEGDVNVPDSLRKIIGETAVIDGRQAALQVARDFGVSPSSVSAYAKGATSTTSYNQPKSDIISHINKSRQRAIKKASKTLNQALGAITQDKLDYADASDLSGIAKDMSVIIKNLEPASNHGTELDGVKTPQFVIYAPQFKTEQSFEVITVNE